MQREGVSEPAVERRIVSVLFADLVGFTSLSERLDPEDVATLQDAYFSVVRETIGRYGGVLEKFIGDAAMAVFGIPRGRDDDAERAVRAGLALTSAVEQLEARLGLAQASLRLRVGVNSGEVVYATAGTDAGRVTGDTVNAAARLQTAARPGGVLVGELTALSVRDAVELAPMGALDLKGKAEPVRAWEAVSVRAQPSRDEALGSLRAPLLGRDAELTDLLATMDQHGSQRSAGRWLVVAPPGVGKSRLLAEFATRAAEGATVLRARLRPGSAAPYEAVAELLYAALGERGGDPGDAIRAALTAAGQPAARAGVVVDEALALLAPAAGAGEASVNDLGAEREVRFAAWIEAIDALTAGAAAWIIEDVHWAGGDLLAFLAQAADAPTDPGRMILASARPSILDTAADWCRGAETQLDLGPLPVVDASALVTALIGDSLPAELVETIATRSDGNPLFIEELLRTWISVGTLAPAGDGAWRLAVDPGSVRLPQTVQAIYAAQLDDLPPDARLVARRASVAGRRFSEAALEPLEVAEQRPGLDTLRRRAFVAGPQPDPLAGDVYAYRHALLRDAGYASLARAERARLHAALARWLSETAGDGADAVAESIGTHYADAHDSLSALAAGSEGLDRGALARAAADWLERAAEVSLGLAAHEAGLRLLDRSIELTSVDAGLDLARRRLRRGEVLAETADLDVGIGAMEVALEAFGASLADGSAEARTGYARAAHALGAARMQQLAFQPTELLTADALARLANAGSEAEPDAGTVRLMALHAWAVAAQGKSDGVRDALRRALDAARAIGDRALELDVLERAYVIEGELEDSAGDNELAVLEVLERGALELGRWRQAVSAMRMRGLMVADQRPADGLLVLDAAGDLAQAHGLTEQVGWCDLSRAETLFVAGDWDAALEIGDRALAVADRYAYVRLGFRLWMVLLPMVAARRDANRADRFDAWWERSAEHFPPSPSPFGAVLRAAIPSWTALARGGALQAAPADVAGLTKQVFSNPHFIEAIETNIEAWLADGQRDPAVVARDNLRAAAAAPDATPLMRASAALATAWVAAATGDAATGDAATGDADAAADAAREALEAARTLGAAWWIVRATRALDAAGAALPALLAEAGALEDRMGLRPAAS